LPPPPRSAPRRCSPSGPVIRRCCPGRRAAALLYVKGRIELLNRQTVGIVGSRDASAGGQKIAATLPPD
jgi:hypothetical protein